MNKINAAVLLRVIERFARGSFEVLFNQEWRDAEAFIRAGNDYVPAKDRAMFAEAVRQAVK